MCSVYASTVCTCASVYKHAPVCTPNMDPLSPGYRGNPSYQGCFSFEGTSLQSFHTITVGCRPTCKPKVGYCGSTARHLTSELCEFPSNNTSVSLAWVYTRLSEISACFVESVGVLRRSRRSKEFCQAAFKVRISARD